MEQRCRREHARLSRRPGATDSRHTQRPIATAQRLGFATVADSLIQELLKALDALDLDAATSLFSSDAELVTTYGQHGRGADQVRSLLGELLGELRATKHTVTSEWNPEPGVSLAEMTATYELKDFSERGPYRRAAILRSANGRIEQLAIYGTHELPLPEAERSYTEVRGPHGWLPTL